MLGAGIAVESSKGEWSLGQQEINLRYGEPISTADDHVIYKNGAKEIAHAKGVSLTFMAKYDMNQAGSSFHLHSSLWDEAGARNLFHADGAPHGSAPFPHRVAGQLAPARQRARFVSPCGH